MKKFEIYVNGNEVEIEVEDKEVWEALEDIEGVSKEDYENEGFGDEDEYLEDLVDGCYTELCEYFEDKKADDIEASWEMQREIESYYRYGRNF